MRLPPLVVAQPITIRIITQDALFIKWVNGAVGATISDNMLIILQEMPVFPYDGETEVYRFSDSLLAAQVHQVVEKAIAERWEVVELRIQEGCLVMPERVAADSAALSGK